jgi:hypothetical protein
MLFATATTDMTFTVLAAVAFEPTFLIVSSYHVAGH